MTKSVEESRKLKGRRAPSKDDGTIVIHDAQNARDRLEVPMSASLMSSIRANPAGLERLIRGFVTSASHARETGLADGFTVTINADGETRLTALDRDRLGASPVAAEDEDHGDAAAAEALAAARARGAVFTSDLLGHADMLSADELAVRLGVTRVTINARRRQRELLGLEGAKRGYRYPVWQLDPRGAAFSEVAKLFAILGDDPWEVFRFLSQRHSALDGEVAHAALAAGRGGAVLAAARAYADGSFA